MGGPSAFVRIGDRSVLLRAGKGVKKFSDEIPVISTAGGYVVTIGGDDVMVAGRDSSGMSTWSGVKVPRNSTFAAFDETALALSEDGHAKAFDPETTWLRLPRAESRPARSTRMALSRSETWTRRRVSARRCIFPIGGAEVDDGQIVAGDDSILIITIARDGEDKGEIRARLWSS